MKPEDEIRRLKFRLKQSHKTQGAQGETIFRLRAELAEARSCTSKLERGELRRMQRAIDSLTTELFKAVDKVGELEDELAKLQAEKEPV